MTLMPKNKNNDCFVAVIASTIPFSPLLKPRLARVWLRLLRAKAIQTKKMKDEIAG